jgi:hypothetical protein
MLDGAVAGSFFPDPAGIREEQEREQDFVSRRAVSALTMAQCVLHQSGPEKS